jgi:hypothetical protein
MIIVTLLALAQAASAPAPAPGQRTATSAPTAGSWSILNPPDCPVVNEGDKTIVVCAPGTESGARLPLPDWGPPDRPVASNPNMTAIRALELDGTPCAATQRGCQSGFGPPIAPLVAGAVALAKSAFAKKPDKTGRIAIDLTDPAPPPPARP